MYVCGSALHLCMYKTSNLSPPKIYLYVYVSLCMPSLCVRHREKERTTEKGGEWERKAALSIDLIFS